MAMLIVKRKGKGIIMERVGTHTELNRIARQMINTFNDAKVKIIDKEQRHWSKDMRSHTDIMWGEV